MKTSAPILNPKYDDKERLDNLESQIRSLKKTQEKILEILIIKELM